MNTALRIYFPLSSSSVIKAATSPRVATNALRSNSREATYPVGGGSLAPLQRRALAGQAFRHEIAVVVYKPASSIELDGTVSVIDLQAKSPGAVLARDVLGEVQELCTNSFPTVPLIDVKFVNPRAFAMVFETEIEAHSQIGDGGHALESQVDDADSWISQEFCEIETHYVLVERLVPGFNLLHPKHEQKDGFKIRNTSVLEL
jgi:hypothetical protein